MTAEKRFTLSAYERELSVAFQNDVEKFLLDFEKLKTFKFEHFAQVWKKLGFSFVFGEQHYYSILKQYTENCFFIIKKFIIFPRSIYTQVGAIFLLYGIYFKQPVKEWVKIRLTKYEYDLLQGIINQMRTQNEEEIVYCYSKLVDSNAFEFVALKKPIAPEDRYQKNPSEYHDDTFKSIISEHCIDKFDEILTDNNCFEKLKNTNKEYLEALKKYAIHSPALLTFKSTIEQDIQTTTSRLKGCSQPIEDAILSDVKKGVRSKAMSNTNAKYRGERECLTSFDINMEEEDDNLQ